MKHEFRAGIALGLEGEGVEAVPYDVESATIDEVNEARQAHELANAELTDLQDAATALEALAIELTAIRGMGIESDTLPFVDLTMDRVEQLSGLRYNGESFRAGSAIGLVASLEGISEMINQMWEKFKTVWRKVVSTLRQFLRKIIGYFKGSKKADELVDKLANKDFENFRDTIPLETDRIQKIMAFGLTKSTFGKGMSDAAHGAAVTAYNVLHISLEIGNHLISSRKNFETVLTEYLKGKTEHFDGGEYLHKEINFFHKAGEGWANYSEDKSSVKLGPLMNGLIFEVAVEHGAVSTYYHESTEKVEDSIAVGVPNLLRASAKDCSKVRKSLVEGLERMDKLIADLDSNRYYESFERKVEELGDQIGPHFRANFAKFMRSQRGALNVLQNAMTKALVEEIRNIDALVTTLDQALTKVGANKEA